MKSPSDTDQMNYYHERWLKEKDSAYGTESAKNELKMGYIAYHISQLISEYNELADQVAYTKRFWWWQYALTKRVLNKFKVKYICRSQKAKEYFKKLIWKECKVKGKRLEDVHKRDIYTFLCAMCIEDKTHGSHEHYEYILRRLEK